jgi:hypothetical protein
MPRIILLAFACCWAFAAAAQQVPTQKFLVLDRYTTKRIKLQVGDPIWFRLKGEGMFRMNDYIKELRDTTLVLGKRDQEIALSDIEAFYFHRGFWRALGPKMAFMGAGFLISGLVQPLIGGAQYDRGEAFAIGASAVVLSQSTRIFYRKRFRLGTSRARARIIDLRMEGN